MNIFLPNLDAMPSGEVNVNEDKIKQIMAQVKSFPGMPVTAAKLVKMLKNSESTAYRLKKY